MKKPAFQSLGFIVLIVGVIVSLTVGIWLNCSHPHSDPVSPEEMQTPGLLSKANPQIQQIMKIQQKHTDKLLNIPGVIGMGIGMSSKGKSVIRVYLLSADVKGFLKI